MCRYINREVRNREAEKQICSNYYFKRYTRVFSVLFKKIHLQILTFSLLTDHRLQPRFLTTILSTSSHKKTGKSPRAKLQSPVAFFLPGPFEVFPRKRRKGPRSFAKVQPTYPRPPSGGGHFRRAVTFDLRVSPLRKTDQPDRTITPISRIFFGGPDSAPRRRITFN